MDCLEYKGYLGSVEYNKADKCLCGKVLGMAKDLILYEGNTVEELETDFRDGIESYFESCAEMGISPRKSYNGVLNIRIPSEIHGQAVIYATRHGITLNAFIREAIEQRLVTQ
jgi:predicted HicB family RNase H-like nuclease